MENYFLPRTLTPEELAVYKARMESGYNDNMARNQQINTAANIAKNVSPFGSLGMLLGTIGVNMYNDYRQRGLDNAINRQRFRQQAQGLNADNSLVNLNGERRVDSPLATTALLPNQNPYTFSLPALPEKWGGNLGQRYQPTNNWLKGGW